MRIGAALLAICGLLTCSSLACSSVRADWVPPFKGNDTGGIISTQLIATNDVRLLAVEHCARYGKVVKFLGQQAYYGGYVSFSCRWVPYGATEAPLRTRY